MFYFILELSVLHLKQFNYISFTILYFLIGHHNDCFLASDTDFGTYVDVTTEYPYLEQDTTYVSMGGETCALNPPRFVCLDLLCISLPI